MLCKNCGEKEAIGNAHGVWYCQECAVILGVACSACGYDSGNGAGGYSNCCGAPLNGVLERGERIENHQPNLA